MKWCRICRSLQDGDGFSKSNPHKCLHCRRITGVPITIEFQENPDAEWVSLNEIDVRIPMDFNGLFQQQFFPEEEEDEHTPAKVSGWLDTHGIRGASDISLKDLSFLTLDPEPQYIYVLTGREEAYNHPEILAMSHSLMTLRRYVGARKVAWTSYTNMDNYWDTRNMAVRGTQYYEIAIERYEVLY